MANILVSSLADSYKQTNIALFKELFALHGALNQSSSIKLGNMNKEDFSEVDRVKVVPLVFGLMPTSALSRKSITVAIKPDIKEHLKSLGISQGDEKLIDIIKNISDQFFTFKILQNNKQYKKFTLGKVQSTYPKIYRSIRDMQEDRCAICGIKFNDSPVDEQDREELDHCLPFYLVGDILDGSNWQLLCKRCNSAKSSYISIFQYPEAINWVYNKETSKLAINDLSKESRYILLVQKGCCEEEGCQVKPSKEQLFVIQKSHTGLAVVGNLSVYCRKHTRQFRVQG